MNHHSTTTEYKCDDTIDQGGYADALHDCPHLATNTNTQYKHDNNIFTHQLFTPHNQCTQCDSSNELWLCLQCYRLYCSRYSNQHMLQHSNHNTAHSICCNLSDLSFWCYTCNSYIYYLTNIVLYNIYQKLHCLKFHEYSPQPIQLSIINTIYAPNDIYMHTQSITQFAVYGTLRTDDHTASSWTEHFVAPAIHTVYGKINYARLYQKSTNNFPYALQSTNMDDTITVQILTYPLDIMADKLVEADEIENYSVDDEYNSEYIRRALYVHTIEHTYELCWIYFVNSRLYEIEWRLIDTGDWCQQHKI